MSNHLCMWHIQFHLLSKAVTLCVFFPMIYYSRIYHTNYCWAIFYSLWITGWNVVFWLIQLLLLAVTIRIMPFLWQIMAIYVIMIMLPLSWHLHPQHNIIPWRYTSATKRCQLLFCFSCFRPDNKRNHRAVILIFGLSCIAHSFDCWLSNHNKIMTKATITTMWEENL